MSGNGNGKSMAEIKKEQELAKNKAIAKKDTIVSKKEKTVLELFHEELGTLNESQLGAFEKIKSVRLNACLLEEYEAFAIDTVDLYVNMITHLINDKIRFENGGVVVKLRTPIYLGKESNHQTQEVKVLFETNKSRERAFLKNVKSKPKDPNYASDQSDALIAASLESVIINKIPLIISASTYRQIKSKDAEIIGTCYNFFRL